MIRTAAALATLAPAVAAAKPGTPPAWAARCVDAVRAALAATPALHESGPPRISPDNGPGVVYEFGVERDDFAVACAPADRRIADEPWVPLALPPDGTGVYRRVVHHTRRMCWIWARSARSPHNAPLNDKLRPMLDRCLEGK